MSVFKKLKNKNLQSVVFFPNMKLSRRDVCQDCSKSCLNPALVVSLNPRLVGELVVYKIRATEKSPESHDLS